MDATPAPPGDSAAASAKVSAALFQRKVDGGKKCSPLPPTPPPLPGAERVSKMAEASKAGDVETMEELARA